MNALEVFDLRKTYSNNLEALKGIDLQVKPGEFYALLGPNGAGKSTLISIVSSLTNKTSGQIDIFGISLEHKPREAKRYIGLVPQEFNFNVFEPLIEIIVNQAGYYGIKSGEANRRAEKYLKQLDLWEKRREIPRRLSGGMKRRLMIVRALIHEPRLLILDEPSAGVDTEFRHSMWQFLKEINNNGTTIILTTHYLEEAESLCEKVAIIDGGKIVEQGAVSELIAKAEHQTFIFDVSADPAKITAALNNDLLVVVRNDRQIEIEITENSTLRNAFELFSKHNIEIRSMRSKYNRLEELFLNLVKRN
jgi:ABC-2 type transport system ATP-binding protein